MRILEKKYKLIGIILSIISLVYIFSVIRNSNLDSIPFDKYSFTKIFLSFFLLSIINIFTLFLSSLIWKYVLEFISQNRINTSEIVGVYFKSNISKYLPGNVMQYASRNFLGYKFGWDQKQMLYSSILEVVLSTVFVLLVLSGLLILDITNDLYKLYDLLRFDYLYPGFDSGRQTIW